MMSSLSPDVLDEFKRYAYFSVRVDRYFHAISVFGSHRKTLKTIYASIPDQTTTHAFLASNADDEIRRFLDESVSGFADIASTNFFIDDQDKELGDLSKDALNFAFYTCYCFQWSLFEDVVKTLLTKAMEARASPATVVADLEASWRNTEKLLKLPKSGKVFGHNPFTSALPTFPIEKIGYGELDAIRRRRNAFVHGVESPDILADSMGVKQRNYSRSMWILRKFAENIHFDVRDLLLQKKAP